jgi:hypothetical protein
MDDGELQAISSLQVCGAGYGGTICTLLLRDEKDTIVVGYISIAY